MGSFAFEHSRRAAPGNEACRGDLHPARDGSESSNRFSKPSVRVLANFSRRVVFKWRRPGVLFTCLNKCHSFTLSRGGEQRGGMRERERRIGEERVEKRKLLGLCGRGGGGVRGRSSEGTCDSGSENVLTL